MVTAALARLAHPQLYRTQVKGDHIEVYEREGMDAADLARLERELFPGIDRELLRRTVMERGRFAPVLRFALQDADRRIFVVERMTYRGAGGWRPVERPAPSRPWSAA